MKQKKLRLVSEEDYNKIAVRKQPAELKMDDMQVSVSIEIDSTGTPNLKDFKTSFNHRVQLSDDLDGYVDALTRKLLEDVKDVYYLRYTDFEDTIQQQRYQIRELEHMISEYKDSIKKMSIYKLIIHWFNLRK